MDRHATVGTKPSLQMCETLVAILLVTSSAKGSNLVYRWPPCPESAPRLARPRPNHDITCAYGDDPWRAANASDSTNEGQKVCPASVLRGDEEGYIWRRPNASRRRSVSHSRSHATSRRPSPSRSSLDGAAQDGPAILPADDDYDSVLGYHGEFLAGLLCPNDSICHQKFGLMVDDLACIGHPVCAEPDGSWRFKPEKTKVAPRGRGSKKGETPQLAEHSLTPERSETSKPSADGAFWLRTFHLAFVLDRPDPSSSSSGAVYKYFNVVYEHIAFTVTAVLYQEQVLYNFVENECDALGTLKDEYMGRGNSFMDYMAAALKMSSLASAMKSLYEAIKDRSIARITIHDLPLELQLPSYTDSLLHPENAFGIGNIYRKDDDGFADIWGDSSPSNNSIALHPWKALLRLDDEDEDPYMRTPQLSAEDSELAEQLFKFMDLASISLSLADMASLLDWDLESQVYPIVRWLVHHRRAKLVDIVHHGLKTVFAIPQKLGAPLAELSSEFDRAFAISNVPPLPRILSMVSMATHQQTANHFYATVVGSKELIPLYQEVVVWMLKRDLLITLHLRIRIVATEDLKDRVRMKFEMARAKRDRIRARSQSADHDTETGSSDTPRQADHLEVASSYGTASGSSIGTNWLSLSPKSARKQAQLFSAREHGVDATHSHSDSAAEKWRGEYEDEFGSSGEEFDREDWYRSVDNNPYSSIISDPARATRLESLWLTEMSEGKDPAIARRFEKINQYFDGKCTDDEILFRAEISRKQLREVLGYYEEYLETFLHPA